MAFADLVAEADRAAREHLGGVTVVYRPADGDPVDVEGMFDATYVVARDEHTGVEQTAPALFVRLADLPAHPDDDDPTIEHDGRLYSVRERQPDGMGGIRLVLERAPEAES